MDVPRINAPSGYRVVARDDGSFDVVADAHAVNPVLGWVAARAAETSTQAGIVGGTVLAPTIADNVSNAIAAGLAGNYLGAAMYGIPAVAGIVSALAAIIVPESKSKSFMPHD